jgi:hypothetical protein
MSEAGDAGGEPRPLLVWNGRVARLRRKDAKGREPIWGAPPARLPPDEPSQRAGSGVSVRDMSRKRREAA